MNNYSNYNCKYLFIECSNDSQIICVVAHFVCHSPNFWSGTNTKKYGFFLIIVSTTGTDEAGAHTLHYIWKPYDCPNIISGVLYLKHEVYLLSISDPQTGDVECFAIRLFKKNPLVLAPYPFYLCLKGA